jgi:hypothetical protein
MACVPTSKTVTSNPQPPGGGGTGVPNTFLCYQVKCPKSVKPALDAHDQFGARTVQVGNSKLLCAPAVDHNGTTTTVPTTSTTLCPLGQTLCNGNCIDTQSDVANCGGCNFVCSVQNATSACVGGQCTVGACATGYADCDNLVGNGCEVNVQSDPLNCGTCNANCSTTCTGNVASTACTAGACSVASCQANYYDFDGFCLGGCECTDVGLGGTFCAGAFSIGTVPQAVTQDRSGNLRTGSQSWFQVTFGSGGGKIEFIANPSAAYRFDVFSNCSSAVCFNSSSSCTVGAGTYQVGVKTASGAGVCIPYTLRYSGL